jgi:hypothetical protein
MLYVEESNSTDTIRLARLHLGCCRETLPSLGSVLLALTRNYRYFFVIDGLERR